MGKAIGTIVGALIVIFGCLALEALLCMYVWNTAIVYLFNANVINFWIGLGIMIVINFAIALFREW